MTHTHTHMAATGHLRTLLLKLLLLSGTLASAASGTLFRNITITDGLASNTVRHIVQDRRGFIWMGTDNGLCRYDGVGFRLFSNPAIGEDQCVSSLLVVGDSLVVGTLRGLYSFSFSTGAFTPIILPSSANVPARQHVVSLTIDHDSVVWVASRQGAAYSYSLRTGQSRRYDIGGGNLRLGAVYADNDNSVWLLADSGSEPLWRFDKAHHRFVRHGMQAPASAARSLAMLQTRDGRRWLGTWEHGIVELKPNGELATPLPGAAGALHIHALYEQSPDCILVGCDAGLLAFNPLTSSLAPVTGKKRSPNFVYSIVKDNEGGIWMGTFYEGVHYISPLGGRFMSFTNAADRTLGLSGTVISRFCEDSRGNIWVASDDGGLSCYSPSLGTFLDFPSRSQLSSLNVHSLYVEDGKLWIGTYSDGLYTLDIASGVCTPCKGAPRSVYSMFRDSRGNLWIGTLDGVQAMGVRNLGHDMRGLVIDIDEDRQGNVWFCSQGDGLWTYSLSGRKWHHFVSGKGKGALPSEQINSICIDADGRVLLGTAAGACVYESSTKTFRLLDISTDMRGVAAIVESQGVLWMSSDKGILRYSPDDGVQAFTRHDGLVGEQYQPSSSLLASDGRIYFGSVRGFDSFMPYQIKSNKVMPPVYITSLEIMNKVVPVGSDKLPLSLSAIPQLDLGHDDTMFSLSFAALSYCSPAKNQYAYMLEGFDADWIYVGAQHKATYTNIPAGEYVFRVKATNNDGLWSPHEARLRIVVHPPFWWSWPARIFYFLLLCGIIYMVMQYRLRKAERQHARELRRMSQKREIEERELRLRFFTMIAHEIRTPVSLIIGPLEAYMRKVARNDALEMIDRNAHRLLELVNQLLDFNKVQQQGLELHYGQHDIAELVEAVAERFAPSMEQRGITFDVVVPQTGFVAIVDCEGITKIVSNLLTNALKYTSNHVSLECRVSAGGSHFVIEVSDNGIGISPKEQQKIFSPFYQARDNKPGTGIGLSIVKNIVELHHGEVTVSSAEGKGSCFSVTLPVDCSLGEAAADCQHDTHGNALAECGTAEPCDANVRVEPSADSVLLVDDDDDMLRFLSSNFSPHYAVYTASNGAEALDLLRGTMVSMIVSDWMMPVMDGAELCRKIRSDRALSHIPFVLLTAKTDDDSKVEAMQCGADAYIEKPFSLRYLQACIRNMVDMRQSLFRKFTSQPEEKIPEISMSPLDNELLSRMNQLILDNIDNTGLNVSFLADNLGISRSGLFAKVKSITNVTPNEMIQVIRLKKAAELLAQQRYRVNEVCYKVGFNSPSYFAKCFARQFGMTPGAYVEEVRARR